MNDFIDAVEGKRGQPELRDLFFRTIQIALLVPLSRRQVRLSSSSNDDHGSKSDQTWSQ